MEPGKTVRLKSGGPLMTVKGKAATGSVICVWFDKESKYQEGTFPPATLVEEEPEKPMKH